MPIVLICRDYWQRVVNFDRLLEEEMISPDDVALFTFADTAEEAWEALQRRGLQAHAPAPQR